MQPAGQEYEGVRVDWFQFTLYQFCRSLTWQNSHTNAMTMDALIEGGPQGK